VFGGVGAEGLEGHGVVCQKTNQGMNKAMVGWVNADATTQCEGSGMVRLYVENLESCARCEVF
jgi:hypothetical protein